MIILLAIVVLIAFVGAILSLFIPHKVGFFLKAPTRLRVFACYFAVLVVAFIFIPSTSDKTEKPEMVQEEVMSVTKDEVAAVEEAAAFEILPYLFERTEDTSHGSRNRKNYFIILNEQDASKITPINLLATVTSAAKYYAEESGADVVAVYMHDQKGINWGQTRLASISYSPDNGGYSGEQDWTWDQAGTSARTTTDLEKTITKTRNAMRKDFQTADGTDEAKLKEAIAKKLNIDLAQVTLPYLMKEEATVDYDDVKATKPQ